MRPRTRRGRRLVGWRDSRRAKGFAGWLACALVVATLLSGCGGSDESAPPAPESPTTPTTTELASTETTAEVEYLLGRCCGGYELEPGRYRSPPWFESPFSLDVPAGWSSVADTQVELVLLGRGLNSIGHLDHYLAFFTVPSPDSFLRELRNTPKLESGEIRDVTVAGLPARRFDAVASPNPSEKGDRELAAGSITIPAVDSLTEASWSSETPAARFRFTLVDVEGRTFFVYLEAPPGDFEAFAAEAEDILRTLSFSE